MRQATDPRLPVEENENLWIKPFLILKYSGIANNFEATIRGGDCTYDDCIRLKGSASHGHSETVTNSSLKRLPVISRRAVLSLRYYDSLAGGIVQGYRVGPKEGFGLLQDNGNWCSQSGRIASGGRRFIRFSHIHKINARCE